MDYNNAKLKTVTIMYAITAFVVFLATAIIIPFIINSTKEGRHILNQLLHVPRKVILSIRDALTEIISNASGRSKAEEQENKPIEFTILEMSKLSKRAGFATNTYSDKLFYVSYYFIPLAILLFIFEGIALGRYLLFQSYTGSLNKVLNYYKSTTSLPTVCLKALLYQQYLYWRHA